MRVSGYDATELERQIGPRGHTSVNSQNRDKVRAWLLAQGFPSIWVQRARIATLYRAYNKPNYFSWLDRNRDKLGSFSGDMFASTYGDDDTPDPGMPEDIDDNEPEEIAPIPQRAPQPVPQPTPQAGAIETAIQALINASTPQLDEQRVIQLIADYATRPQIKEIVVEHAATGERVNCGLQHFKFEKLLKACTARDHEGNRLNVWLSGPAGTGKTSAAKAIAKALNLPYHFTGALDTEYKLLGFVDAQGRVVNKPFRQAYEHGGVFLFDEIDRSFNAALIAFNAALSVGYCDFPDGPVQRHPDCVIIAAANTYGLGGGSDMYTAAGKQDASLLDRFAFIDWPIDETLESVSCPDTAWCEYVQKVRKNVAAQGLRIVVSPRASYIGASLLATGLDKEDVIAMTLRKGMSDEQWSAVA